MTPLSSTTDKPASRPVVLWLLFPLSLFPFIALLTYDWHAIETLYSPALPHSNWIGALGDFFAYYGYLFFGLAIWIVPVACVIFTWKFIHGMRLRLGLRFLFFLLFLFSTACLLQVMSRNWTLLTSLSQHVNTPNAGGAFAYLIMTCALAPLISDFASAILASTLLIFSLVALIGIARFKSFFQAIYIWATLKDRAASTLPDGTRAPTDANNPFASNDPQAKYLAALRAREEVTRQKAEEKERIRAEKLAEKERKQEEKERLRAEKEAAKEARRHPVVEEAPSAKPPSENPPSEEDKGPYLLPSLALLNPLKKSTADHGDVGEMTHKLVDTLKLFGVDASLAYTTPGPVVTKYALTLAPGTRYSVVTNLQDNLMGALHAKSIRIEAPIPGEEYVGIEVPNRTPAGISFREIIESDTWKNFRGELPLLFGKDAAGHDLIADLASMPHMLVAGATGQGKSVCLNAIINGLLMTKTPEQLKLIMVDPKSVEFTAYASLPHLIVPVITDNRKVVFSLHWAVAEMEKRLKLFARARVRNIYDFNHRPNYTQTDMFGDDSDTSADMPRTVPYIVIIIDEVADLMAAASKEVTPDISRLTAKARAAGIHLILATQRPDAKIITGTIKANIPGRVAFKTATSIDSRTILDETGAENLIGRGDMLFKGKDGLLIRAQGAWISDPEIANVTKFIEEHSNPAFDDRFTKKLSTIKEEEVDLFAEDESETTTPESAQAAREQVKADENASDFKKAVECIINTQRASTSHFQRKLGWGYNHSAKIMDMLEDAGIIGPQLGAGPRQIIMDQDQLLAVFKGGSADASGKPTATPAEGSADDTFSLSDETPASEAINEEDQV